MNKALISLASNDKDKQQILANIEETLRHHVTVIRQTPVYLTTAVGTALSSEYANALMLVETEETYESLRHSFKIYEQQAGRTALSKLQGIVPLDIDIISWNGIIIKQKDLQYEYMKEGLAMLDMNVFS